MPSDDVRVLLLGEEQDAPEILADLAADRRYRPVGRLSRLSLLHDAVRARRPDVVVAGVHSLEQLQELVEVVPATSPPVVVVAGLPPEVALLTALAAGARAFLRSPVAPGLLGHAVAAVLAGHVYVDPACTAWLVDFALHGFKARPGSGLSLRQSQVVQLARGGLTNREIAQALGVSAETVKSHLHEAMRRLDARSRWDAGARAHRPRETS